MFRASPKFICLRRERERNGGEVFDLLLDDGRVKGSLVNTFHNENLGFFFFSVNSFLINRNGPSPETNYNKSPLNLTG